MPKYRAVDGASPDGKGRIGVLVVNLGTPSNASYWGVWRYLREFLSDVRVINAPRFIWLPVLYAVVLTLRSARSARAYRKVWLKGGSPLGVFSRALTDKLALSLTNGMGDGVRVELAMTYGSPPIGAGIEKLMRQDVRRLLVLPLYPQYCSSTTGAVFDRVTRALAQWRWLPETRFVNDYFAQSDYIGAIAQSIEQQWDAAGARSHLILSFHGIPESAVAQGDPYQAQTQRTAQLIVARLGLLPSDWTLAYQSRFGPVKWLQPYTADVLKDLAAKGVARATIVSPSFAVDCLETLEEIGVEYCDAFSKLGGRLDLVPALNDSDAHTQLLKNLVEKHVRGWD